MSLEHASITQIYNIFSELSYYQIYKISKQYKNLQKICKRPEFRELINKKIKLKAFSLFESARLTNFKPNLYIRQIKLNSTKSYREFYLSYLHPYYWIEEYLFKKHKKKVLYSKKERNPFNQLTFLITTCYII